MPHHTPLIGTIVAGLVVAFFMGALAHRLKVSPIAGYLLAGVMVGPFTPGFVADAGLANELAEIGVILLMFGVGLHFSLRDLLAVKNIAVPGAIVQIAAATVLGMGLSWLLGWDWMAGLVFGLALSVASTVVLLRALQGHNLVETHKGQIAVGWLIVEDLVMVLALVLLPAMAQAMQSADGGGAGAMIRPLVLTIFKVTGFVALMLIVGRRLIPAVLHWVVHSGSRELFRLAVLAIALGVAFGAAYVFDVSFALGAFFAGMILGETPLSRRATEETLPLRDAFAVLFFVSVGMLFNPAVLVDQPLPLIATVAIILIGKSLAAWVIVRAFGHDNGTALIIAASLAQIGEFSFILASLGGGLGLLPQEGRDLILAGAILSIFVNPFLFTFIMRFTGRDKERTEEVAAPPPVQSNEHVIVIGYGRVGKALAEGLKGGAKSIAVIEDDGDKAKLAESDGLTVVRGNALENRILLAAGVEKAGHVLIAVPEGFEGGAIFHHVRDLNPATHVIVRAHSDAEVEHLEKRGVRQVVMGERELARRMLTLCGVQVAAR